MTRNIIRRETQFFADIDVVWDLVSDFGGWPRWFPNGGDDAFVESYETPAELLTERGGEVSPGQNVLEVVRENNAETRTLSYSLTVSPFPIENHLATVQVNDLGGGQVAVTWQAEFDGDEAVATQLEQIMGEHSFTPGLKGLESRAQAMSA